MLTILMLILAKTQLVEYIKSIFITSAGTGVDTIFPSFLTTYITNITLFLILIITGIYLISSLVTEDLVKNISIFVDEIVPYRKKSKTIRK